MFETVAKANRCKCIESYKGFHATDLQSDGVFMFPFHVIDVPGDAGHGVDGLLHHLVTLFFRVEVLGNFLHRQQKLG